MKAMNYCPLMVKGHNYLSNGTGRDSYIYYNNGGLNTTTYYKPQPKPINFKYTSKRVIRPYSTPKYVNYHNDGTGRDVYVSHEHNKVKFSFENQLRTYKQLTKKDFNVKKNIKLTETGYHLNNLTQRLATPKAQNNIIYKLLLNKMDKRFTIKQRNNAQFIKSANVFYKSNNNFFKSQNKSQLK